MHPASAICFMLVGVLVGAAKAADEPPIDRPQVQLSLSRAVATGTGSLLAAGRYGDDWGLRLGAWLYDKHVDGLAPDGFIGVDRLWTYDGFRYGLGAAWLNSTNDLNGTHWNFSISVAYKFSERVFVEIIHFSHGTSIGIRRDAPNDGWDFLGLGFAL
jgi:hypothetical protein